MVLALQPTGGSRWCLLRNTLEAAEGACSAPHSRQPKVLALHHTQGNRKCLLCTTLKAAEGACSAPHSRQPRVLALHHTGCSRGRFTLCSTTRRCCTISVLQPRMLHHKHAVARSAAP